jgi:hypothetical protein
MDMILRREHRDTKSAEMEIRERRDFNFFFRLSVPLRKFVLAAIEGR